MSEPRKSKTDHDEHREKSTMQEPQEEFIAPEDSPSKNKSGSSTPPGSGQESRRDNKSV
jgi:hypothetical protein